MVLVDASKKRRGEEITEDNSLRTTRSRSRDARVTKSGHSKLYARVATDDEEHRRTTGGCLYERSNAIHLTVTKA